MHPPTNRRDPHACTARERCIACERVSAYAPGVEKVLKNFKKLWMPKIRKKSPIHDNANANISCDFGNGDISRSGSRLPHTLTDSHIVSSIIVRYGAILPVIMLTMHISSVCWIVSLFYPFDTIRSGISSFWVVARLVPCSFLSIYGWRLELYSQTWKKVMARTFNVFINYFSIQITNA